MFVYKVIFIYNSVIYTSSPHWLSAHDPAPYWKSELSKQNDDDNNEVE